MPSMHQFHLESTRLAKSLCISGSTPPPSRIQDAPKIRSRNQSDDVHAYYSHGNIL